MFDHASHEQGAVRENGCNLASFYQGMLNIFKHCQTRKPCFVANAILKAHIGSQSILEVSYLSQILCKGVLR